MQNNNKKYVSSDKNFKKIQNIKIMNNKMYFIPLDKRGCVLILLWHKRKKKHRRTNDKNG